MAMNWYKSAQQEDSCQVGRFAEIPPALSGLAAEARKYATFEEFRRAFSIQIKHGRYWHVTDNPSFTIDPEMGPKDMSSMGNNRISAGKLMITSHLEYWAENYEGLRPYAAEIDMSDVGPSDYLQVNRGFGNEFMVHDPSKARVVRVLPIKQALMVDSDSHNQLPHDNQELEEFYCRANQQ